LNLKAEVQKQLLELREKDKLLIAQSKLAAVGGDAGAYRPSVKQPLAQINSVVASIEADFEEGKPDVVLRKKCYCYHLTPIFLYFYPYIFYILTPIFAIFPT